MSKFAKRFALFAAVAGAAGYVAGLLTAPQSGKETRGDIKDATNRGITEAEKDLKQLHTELTKLLDELDKLRGQVKGRAETELSQLFDKAKDTKEKAREMISAVHEGDAEDKDLRKAIQDANAAIDHLKDFLKK
jgi:gas vesicle protein